MTTAEERELDKLNSGRLLRDASKELLPLLLRQKEEVIAKIVMAHKAHNSDIDNELRGYAAELSVVTDLANKLTRNNKETAHREGKLDGTSRAE